MFKWIFGKRCEHDFKNIDTLSSRYVNEYGLQEIYKRYVLYCPKCDKTKKVDADKYNLNQKKLDAKRGYQVIGKVDSEALNKLMEKRNG